MWWSASTTRRQGTCRTWLEERMSKQSTKIKRLDTRTYWPKTHAIAQRLQAPLTAPERQVVLGDLLTLLQEHYDAYTALIEDYQRQTATIERLTEALERVTAERNQAIDAGMTAYERGYREFIEYTDSFLAANYDAWTQYLSAADGPVVDPEALSAIDPRPRDVALRLCHRCSRVLE